MNSVFAALVNGAILSSLIALIVWTGLRLTPRRAMNAATRHGVWWATLAATAILPLLYLPPSGHPAQRTQRANSAASPLAVPTHTEIAPRPTPAVADFSNRAPVARPLAWFPVTTAANSVPRWILRTWMFLASLMLMRLLTSYVLLKGRKRRAAAAPPHLAARVETWKARCACSRRSVRLAVSSEIATPMLAGLHRPSILVPAQLLEELDEDEIEQIGLHEVAHLARGDDYALIVQRFLESVFVLNPVVHWIGRTLDLEREIACDDFVLRATGEARAYAACLTRVVELTGGVRGSLTAAAVAEGRSHLSRRVDMLLDGARHNGTRLLKGRLATAIAGIAVLASVAMVAPGLLAFSQPTATPPRPVRELVQQPASVVPQPPVARTISAPQPPPAPSEGPPVRIAVTVQDPLNRYVTGLDPSTFRVTEDGVSQKIASVSNQDVPMSIGILLDTSGSMRGRLADARRAIADFLAASRPASQSFLVTYNDTATLAEGFTSDAARIEKSVDLVQARGGTSLREAILLGLQQMQQAPHPTKALVIVSDGSDDNTSGVTTNDVEHAVTAANIQIYAITLPKSPDDRATSRGMKYLNDLTALTGGQRFVVESGSPLPGPAAGIGRRNSYLIEYHSTNAVLDGRYRKLQVEVIPPRGLPPLKVTHQAGYYVAPKLQ